MNLQLSIMTPESVFWEPSEPVDEVILPTNTGQMGVLPNHADLITAIDIGIVSLRQNNSWNNIAVTNGFAAIRKNRVTLLVNSAESKQTIERNQAEQEFNQAQQTLQTASFSTRKQRVEANLAFKRAKARYLVVVD